MPVSLAQLARNTASVTFPVGEETVLVNYYPARVTERVVSRMLALQSLSEENAVAGFAEFNQILATLIESWDVYEDDEQTKMFPLDAERLSDLPIFFRVRAIQAIVGDMRPEALAPMN